MIERVLELARLGYKIEFRKGYLPNTLEINVEHNTYICRTEVSFDAIDLSRMTAEEYIVQTVNRMVIRCDE